MEKTINNNFKTYGNVRKIAIGRGDDYRTGCFLNYIYFRKYYKMIEVDLSKQQALYADQQKQFNKINFIANLERAENKRFYFILEEAKEIVFEFSQETVKVL